MRQLRHDLNYGVSAALLVAALLAIATGIVAHLWDLNDFVYHTYAGYVMAALSLAHVWLNWRRLVGYARHRLRPRSAALRPAVRALPPAEPPPRAVAARSPRMLTATRRGFLGLGLAGLGFVAGRGLRQPPALTQGSDLGLVYHVWSKPGVIDVLGTVANWGEQPALYKTYPGAPAIALPRPGSSAGLSAEDAMGRRRSTRDFRATPLTLEQLGRVLYFTAGITGDRWNNRLRAAPSSGALYPIEVYPVVHNVAGLEQGVYHYNVQEHALALVQGGDLRAAVARHGLGQQFLAEAGVVLLLTVIFQRMRFKYQDRTYRYGLIEAGHLGQNAYLAATALGLGACAVGAFMDDEINALLGVDGQSEAAIYMLAVGAK